MTVDEGSWGLSDVMRIGKQAKCVPVNIFPISVATLVSRSS